MYKGAKKKKRNNAIITVFDLFHWQLHLQISMSGKSYLSNISFVMHNCTLNKAFLTYYLLFNGTMQGDLKGLQRKKAAITLQQMKKIKSALFCLNGHSILHKNSSFSPKMSTLRFDTGLKTLLENCQNSDVFCPMLSPEHVWEIW